MEGDPVSCAAGPQGPEPGASCPETSELALLRQWHALQSGVRRLADDLLADVEAGQGLAPSSYTALMCLVTAPGQAQPMHRLSAALGFSTAGTTKVVDRLVEAGLAERRPSDSDRRVVYTTLTPAGARTVLAASRAMVAAVRTRVVEPLGEKVFGSLVEAVEKVDPAPASPAC